MQSCATWEYAMKRLSLPIRVTPPPCVVPRLTVENSRKWLASPTTSSVRSPLNFRSCGSPPTEQNESNKFLQPIRAGPRTTACASSTQSSPSSTSSPTTANAPMRTPLPTRAFGETIARGSTSLIARTHRCVCGGFAWRWGWIAVHQHAPQHRFGGDFPVDCGNGFQLAERRAVLEHRHFHAQLISRHDGPPKTRLVHSGKIQKFFFALRNFKQEQQAAGLRHAFDNQNPRHHRLSRKMSLKKALVDRNTFQADDPLQPLDFENSIHHQKRIAVRQNFLDTSAVKNHFISSIFFAGCTLQFHPDRGQDVQRKSTSHAHFPAGCKCSLYVGIICETLRSANAVRRDWYPTNGLRWRIRAPLEIRLPVPADKIIIRRTGQN